MAVEARKAQGKAARRTRTSKADALYDRAHKLHLKGKLDEAIALYRRSLPACSKPGHVHNDLGVALRATGHPRAAAAHYLRAISADPGAADSWANLANAYRQLQRYDEAVAAARKAVEREPGDPDYLANLGILLRQTGALGEAVTCLERALEREPDSAHFRFQLAVTHLKRRSYRKGFALYESRFGIPHGPSRRDFGVPLWTGGSLAGKSLLVYAEQGLGDMIQFARFVPQLLERAERVSIECHAPLKTLLETLDPAIRIHALGEEIPWHDHVVPAASLPHLLGITGRSLVPQIPYLSGRSTAKASGLLPPRTARPRVGLTWRGKPVPTDRSCPFEIFMRLVDVPGADFFSLQRGEAIADIAAQGADSLVVDLGSRLGDFADDAEVLASLDLLVTIDTSICHLAGAMGMPVWTLLRRPAEWRFLDRGDTCPWYPTMRLFRQPSPGDWAGAIDAAKTALAAWIAERTV